MSHSRRAERDNARKEAAELRAELAAVRHFFANLDERMAESRRCADAERERDEARTEVAELRGRVATLTASAEGRLT